MGLLAIRNAKKALVAAIGGKEKLEKVLKWMKGKGRSAGLNAESVIKHVGETLFPKYPEEGKRGQVIDNLEKTMKYLSEKPYTKTGSNFYKIGHKQKPLEGVRNYLETLSGQFPEQEYKLHKNYLRFATRANDPNGVVHTKHATLDEKMEKDHLDVNRLKVTVESLNVYLMDEAKKLAKSVNNTKQEENRKSTEHKAAELRENQEQERKAAELRAKQEQERKAAELKAKQEEERKAAELKAAELKAKQENEKQTTESSQDLIELLAQGTITTEEYQKLKSGGLCKSVKEAILPKGMTVKDEYMGSKALQKITIQGPIDSGDAFKDCVNLETVILTNDVTHIAPDAFFKCSKLKKVTIPGSTGVLQEGTFLNSGLESVIIEDGVKEISDFGFAGCSKLKEIVIPGSVKWIGRGAFSGCDSLESVTMEPGVESIDEIAFKECKKLKRITVPGSVNEIGDRAFESCPKDMKIEGDASDAIKDKIREQAKAKPKPKRKRK